MIRANAQIGWETMVLTIPCYNLQQQNSHKFANVLVSLALSFQNLSRNDSVVEFNSLPALYSFVIEQFSLLKQRKG